METRLKKLKRLEKLNEQLKVKEFNRSSWRSRMLKEQYWIKLWEEAKFDDEEKRKYIKEHTESLEFAKSKYEEFDCRTNDCLNLIDNLKKEIFFKEEK